MLRGDVDEGTRLQGLMITDHSYTSNCFGTPPLVIEIIV